MKEYWSVTTTFDDKGKIQVFIDSTIAAQKPENQFEELKTCDKYVDWFDTEKQAKAFAEKVKKA